MIAWIIYAVLGLLVLFGIVALLVARKKQKIPTDYYNLFVIGIIWVFAGIPLGISTDNWSLFFIGFVFVILGLSHKKEWRKNIADKKKRWNSLSAKEKKFLMWIKWLLFLILVAGIVAFLLFEGLI